MISLRETQQAFLQAVLDGETAAIEPFVRAGGIDVCDRLEVYGNNARTNFLDTLEAGFALLVRLGGCEWFRQTGRAYWKAHPSQSGDLRRIGERFAYFLAKRLAGTPYEYFADVAHLCWAYQEVLDAPDGAPLDLAALTKVPPDRYGELVFELNPAARLVASPWPILEIWRANQSNVAEPPLIRLDAGASRVLVIRRSDHVELRALDVAAFAFLEGCAAGRCFAAVAADVTTLEPQTDLPQLLRRLVVIGAIADFSAGLQSQTVEHSAGASSS